MTARAVVIVVQSPNGVEEEKSAEIDQLVI
jgi:hypothetical protein